MVMKKNKQMYFEQGGCHDCKHVFIKQDWDDIPEYYCTLKAPKRPPCMSVAMKECPGLEDYEGNSYGINEANWRKWSKDREVKAWGLCHGYERKDK